MRRSLTAWFLVTALLLPAAPSLAAEVKIGVLGPLTGGTAVWGIAQREGVQMAADQINAAGGIKGLGQVAVLFEDTQCQPSTGVNAAKKLVYQDKVVAVIGAVCSSVTLATMKVTEAAGIPQVTNSSSAPAITTQGNKFIFRTQITSARSAAGMAEFAVKRLAKRRFGILYTNNDYGVGASSAFEAKLKELGITPLVKETFVEKDKDFAAQLLKVKVTAPEVVGLFAYYEEGALILKQARQIGVDFIPVGTDVLSGPKFIQLAGDTANGVILSLNFVDSNPDPRVQDFVKRFQARFGKTPDAVAAQAYDSMHIMARAIESAGKLDGPAIRDALARTSGYVGLTGETRFNEVGDDLRDFLKVKIENGKYVVVR